MNKSSFKENFNTINKRVAHYRKLANLTQVETAERMGMKVSTYSQMERVGRISGERIVKLAAIFNIDPYLILHNEFDDEAKKEVRSEPQVVTFRQEQTTFQLPAEFTPTAKEIGFLKMLRNIAKPDQQDVINLLTEKHNNRHK